METSLHQDIKHTHHQTSSPFLVNPHLFASLPALPSRNYYSHFYHHKLVLSVLEFPISYITSYAFFLLNISFKFNSCLKSYGDLLYNIVSINKDTLLYTQKSVKRVELMLNDFTTHTKKDSMNYSKFQ